MLCTTLIESNSKEVIEIWLKRFENFLCYIMLLSETQQTNPMSSSKD